MKVTEQRQELSEEEEKHCDIKTHKRVKAKKRGKDSSNLKTHLKDHINERAPSCSVRGKSRSLMENSKERHNDVKDHVCRECGKSFTKVNRLKMHKMIHTGEKPHKCSYCDKSFNQSGHLKSHEQVHTGEKPYYCPPCEKSFRFLKGLERHIKTCPNLSK